LLIPLYDYHPTPALLAFVPRPWPQVTLNSWTWISNSVMFDDRETPWVRSLQGREQLLLLALTI
jgi:hypothetical protein